MPPADRPTATTVTLPMTAFTAIGGGDADPATLTALRRSQLSRHLLLLREVVRTAGLDVAGWYAVLVEAEQAAPGPVRRLLGHPPVGAWAAACLAALRAGRPPLDAGLAYLGALAAVAAMQARLATTVTVPVTGGTLPLPTLGTAVLPDADLAVLDTGSRRIAAGGHRVVVPDDPTQSGPGWRGLRRLATTGAGPRLTVFLDDLDPYRTGPGLAPTGRLTDTQADAWQTQLDDAWQLLRDRHRQHADAIAADLRSLVPLHADGDVGGISATSKHAFGAVALSAPADPTGLAVGLVHEARHGTLNAVQYLFPLFDPTDRRLLYSPWRDDPRPPGGVLHGAYAYLGVTDFWRVERHTAGPAGQFAFARWRAAVVAATGELLQGRYLSGPGVTFATAMLARVRHWLAEPVPPALAYLAGQANTDHRLRWRLRHLSVEPERVRRLAAAWCDGDDPGTTTLRARVRPAPGRQWEPGSRPDRIHARLCGAGDLPGGRPGDRAYARGDEAGAAAAYRTVLAAHPDDDTAWAGLALTTATPGLRTRPELVAAVYRAALRLKPAPADIAELSDWLGAVNYDDGGVAPAAESTVAGG